MQVDKHSAFCNLQFAFCNLQLLLPAYAEDIAPPSLEAREEAALKAAAETVAPSVVQIRTIGGFDSVEGTVLADGPTTGLVISPDGYIISSAFNFAQQPASILVTFASGKQTPAELVATDHSRMLVLLKANGVTDLPVPAMAPLDEIRPGQWAVAVGRTFRADKTNVTVGIVSALGRMFGKAIQTDADVSTRQLRRPARRYPRPRARRHRADGPARRERSRRHRMVRLRHRFRRAARRLADRIEKMKKGEDQRPGLLGIGMPPKNPHSSPAELAAVRPDSPAGQAGLKKGDRIVELNGKPIKTQIDLRFALGTAYGGDEVRVVAMRGKERIERTIKLAGELPPFRHAFLGLLPMRPAIEPPAAADKKPNNGNDKQKSDDKSDDTKEKATADAKKSEPAEKGIAVRMVYDGSPAADAGIQIGDRITNINESKVDSIDDAITAVNNLAPGNKVVVKLARGGESKELTLTAARLPTNIPSDLPSARTAPAAPTDATEKAAAGETRDLKLPEFPNKCRVYVPASHEAGQPQAAILWLQAPSDTKPDDIIREWQSICDRDGILLIVPSACRQGPMGTARDRVLAPPLRASHRAIQNRPTSNGRLWPRQRRNNRLASRAIQPRRVPRHRHIGRSAPPSTASAAERAVATIRDFHRTAGQQRVGRSNLAGTAQVRRCRLQRRDDHDRQRRRPAFRRRA